jgi:hypothetical protein
MKMEKNIPIFFIICKGRSGSTLLAHMLDTNPNTLIPVENTFLIHLYPKYGQIKNWEESTIDSFIDDLYILRKTLKNWKIDREKLRVELYSHLHQNTNYASICQRTYLSFTSIYPKKNILLIGDKNPFYTFCIDEIKEIYPNAKFIHLIRDARANVRSHIVSFKTNFISFIAFKWLHYINEVEDKKEQYPDSFITVRYEDLIKTPELSLREICQFLEINYNPTSLDFHETINTKLSGYKKYSEGIHANLKKPIDPTINEKWKTYFNKKQTNIINVICQKHLKRLKYDYEIKPINNINKVEIFIGGAYYKLWLSAVKKFYKMPFSIKRVAFKIIDIFFK